MTTPKTAQEFVDLLIKNHQEDWGKIEFPQYFKDHALKILQAYLLQESAPLVEALEYCLGKEVFPKGVTAADVETPPYTKAKSALDDFQKKHGGVV